MAQQHAAADDNSPVYDRTVFDSVETGDVVLFNRRCTEMGSPLGIGVCLFAKWTSVYDHVGMVVRPPGEAPQVLEAGFRGVTCKPLEQRLDRVHHDSVAVRHLTFDGIDARATRDRIEKFAKEVDGAPYKRRLGDFLTTALQPPEKRQASEVHSALNSALRQEASLVRLLRDNTTASSRVKAGATRRLGAIREEIEVLQASSMEHDIRQERHLPEVAVGREPSRKAGFVCSELVGEATQRAGIADRFPGPMNYGAHDWSSLAAFTSADEVRHRRPPALAPQANLGPELLLKKQPVAARSSALNQSPDEVALMRSLESLGWSSESAADIKSAFKPLFVQRGEVLDLTRSTIVPQSVRGWVASEPTASTPDGQLQMLLPSGVVLGLHGPSATNEKKKSTAPPSVGPQPRRFVAESDGYVWLADRANCDVIAQRVAVDQLQGRQQGGSVDTRQVTLRRGQAPDGCAKEDPRGAPFALYIVEKGAAHDITVDRVYRQGEVLGLDTFMAHLPSGALHGGWDGPIQSCRRVEAPRPYALREGTVLRRVSYGDVLRHIHSPSNVDPALNESILGQVKDLLTRFAIFHAYCDGQLQNHALRPTLVDHMDLAHRHQYFDIPHLTLLATQLLDTILFQRRDDNFLLFSDVLRVEHAAEKAGAILKSTKGSKKPEARATLYFLGTQASQDGHTVSVTDINDVLHTLYRGRPDAPYISMPAQDGDEKNEFLSDANRMSRKMIFAELLDLCERGAVVVPLTVSADCVLLIRHLNYTCLGDESMKPEPIKTDDNNKDNTPTPERFFDEALVKTIRGEAWDISKYADAVDYARRTAWVILVATGFNAALFPLQFVSWHRMIFGSASRWSIRKALSPTTYFDLITHTVHGIFLRRVLVGSLLTCVGSVSMRPPAPMFDMYLDSLPTYPHWDAVAFGAKVCAATTALTYPFDVALATGLHRSAEAGQGDAMNFHAAQTTFSGAIKSTYAAHGFRGLFRGMHLAPLAATPFFGAHWLWYHEVLVPYFIDKRYAFSPIDGPRPSPDAWYASSSVTAALWKTGVVGWTYLAHTLVVHPFESVRYVSMATQVAPSRAFVSIVSGCGYNPVRVVRRLYSGWATNILRSIPVMFGSFALTGIAVADYRISMPDSAKRKIDKWTSY